MNEFVKSADTIDADSINLKDYEISLIAYKLIKSEVQSYNESNYEGIIDYIQGVIDLQNVLHEIYEQQNPTWERK